MDLISILHYKAQLVLRLLYYSEKKIEFSFLKLNIDMINLIYLLSRTLTNLAGKSIYNT